jgi:hypothetical protein
MRKITEKKVRREAGKYRSRAAFLLGSPEEFYSALESGALDDICSGMVERGLPSPNRKWSPETIATEASKYSTRSEFEKGSKGASDASRRLGIRNDVCAHMVRQVRAKWTPEALAVEALKYNTRSEFGKGSCGAYVTARRLGVLNDVCGHMVRATKWTPETIAPEARKYSTRSEFSKGSGSAYSAAARRLGILDEVCGHMVSNEKKI